MSKPPFRIPSRFIDGCAGTLTLGIILGVILFLYFWLTREDFQAWGLGVIRTGLLAGFLFGCFLIVLALSFLLFRSIYYHTRILLGILLPVDSRKRKEKFE